MFYLLDSVACSCRATGMRSRATRAPATARSRCGCGWTQRAGPGNPAQHVDVKAGDPIEVTVGPVFATTAASSARSSAPTAGTVVAEASSRRADVQEQRREIAVSLNRGSTGLLAGLTEGGALTATVVPARADSSTPIVTLLELLHQHWAKAQAGNGVEYHVLDQTRRNTAMKPLYAAVVEEPPNENGFVTARLLHQDGTLGIRHHFDLNVASRSGPQEAADSGEPTAGLAFAAGDPLLLNVVTDQSRLEVGGLDLDVLTGIVGNSQRQLELTGVRDEEGRAGRGQGEPGRAG